MPACASPAIESPATTATATGRNSGSTIASAATANSDPLVSTADRNAGPWPGRGRRSSVTRDRTATRVGSASSSSDRQPGPRPAEQLGQLDPHHGRSTRSPAAPVRSSTTSSSDAPLRAELVTRMPVATSRRSARPGRWPGSPAGRRRAPRRRRRAARRPRRRRGCARTVRPVGACSVVQLRPAAPAGRGRARRPACTAARPRPAGGWTGRSSYRRRAAPQQQLPDLADALRVQAVRRLVQHEQLRLAQQRSGQAEPLPHAERVRLDRPAAHAAEADLLQRLVDPAAAGGRPLRVPAAARVQQQQVGPPAQVPVRRRPLDQRADRGSTSRASRGIGRPSSSIVPDVASTSPSSIRTVVVLPEPFAPRKP